MKSYDCRATAIGSFPHTDTDDVLALIRECLPDIPVWPQLPNVDYREGMCQQFSEGIPGVVIDEKERRVWVDTSGDFFGGAEKFYKKYLTEDPEEFAISPEYAAGFPAFIEKMKGESERAFAVKGHVTGPVTWGLTIADENRRATYYNENLKDLIVKCMARKARWQVKRLRELNGSVIIFVDEPYLQSIGSSMVALDREDVIEKLDEVFEEIICAGGVPGIHCCGNSDWGLVSRTKTRIINFDAYEYGETISLYPKEITAYLERGGAIAWGIVPASEQALSDTVDSLIGKLFAAFAHLEKHGLRRELLLERSLITPSCGVGSHTLEVSEGVLRLTRKVSDKLRGA
jgi:methionine synthase II (cobalamin-independent)